MLFGTFQNHFNANKSGLITAFHYDVIIEINKWKHNQAIARGKLMHKYSPKTDFLKEKKNSEINLSHITSFSFHLIWFVCEHCKRSALNWYNIYSIAIHLLNRSSFYCCADWWSHHSLHLSAHTQFSLAPREKDKKRTEILKENGKKEKNNKSWMERNTVMRSTA